MTFEDVLVYTLDAIDLSYFYSTFLIFDSMDVLLDLENTDSEKLPDVCANLTCKSRYWNKERRHPKEIEKSEVGD
jgi:hypothetical protein